MFMLLFFLSVFLGTYLLFRVLGWLVILAVWLLVVVPVLAVCAGRFLCGRSPKNLPVTPVDPRPVRTLHLEEYQYPDGRRVYQALADDRSNYV